MWGQPDPSPVLFVQLLDAIAGGFKEKNGAKLAEGFQYVISLLNLNSRLDGNSLNSQMSELSRQLMEINDVQEWITSYLGRSQVNKQLKGVWQSFQTVVCEFFKFVKDELGRCSQNVVLSLEEYRKSYDKFDECFSKLVATVARPIDVEAGGSSWFCPVITIFSATLIYLAFRADGILGKANKGFEGRVSAKKAVSSGKAARCLSKMFNVILMDRTPLNSSKKQAILIVTEQAFKVYFKLNSIRLCKTFINNLKLDSSIDIAAFPIAQRIAYSYYVGRLKLLDHRFHLAHQELNFAFHHCPKRAFKNRKTIFIYLFASKLILGEVPSIKLMASFGMVDMLDPLIRSYLKGNVKAYLAALDAYRDWWIMKGLYLILKQRGIVIVYRNLIRRVFLLTFRNKQNPRPHFNLKDIYIALKYALPLEDAEDLDMDDAASLVISLIDQHYIRGYISYPRSLVVLSNKSAFPPISTVRVTQEIVDEVSGEEDN